MITNIDINLYIYIIYIYIYIISDLLHGLESFVLMLVENVTILLKNELRNPNASISCENVINKLFSIGSLQACFIDQVCIVYNLYNVYIIYKKFDFFLFMFMMLVYVQYICIII